MKLIELSLAAGGDLDIPASAVTMVEELSATKNPTFEDANAFVRYSLGEKDYHALVTGTYGDMVRLLDVNVRPGDWMTVHRPDGDRVLLLKGNVVGRETATAQHEPGSVAVLSVTLDRKGTIGDIGVKESVAELRGLMNPAMPAPSPQPPEGLIEMPVPAQG